MQRARDRPILDTAMRADHYGYPPRGKAAMGSTGSIFSSPTCRLATDHSWPIIWRAWAGRRGR